METTKEIDLFQFIPKLLIKDFVFIVIMSKRNAGFIGRSEQHRNILVMNEIFNWIDIGEDFF